MKVLTLVNIFFIFDPPVLLSTDTFCIGEAAVSVELLRRYRPPLHIRHQRADPATSKACFDKSCHAQPQSTACELP